MKTMLSFLAVAILCLNVSAQTPDVPEPDFVGEVIALQPGSDAQPLQKQTVMLRTRSGFGYGKTKTKLIIDGNRSATRFDSSKPISFIIKAVDNATDPMAIVNIFKFDTNNKQRLAEMMSIGAWGTVKQGKLEHLSFTGKKYGESSYLITLTEEPVGEYGIIVSNPNNLDEKDVIVSTFAIDESTLAPATHEAAPAEQPATEEEPAAETAPATDSVQ